MRSSFNAAPFLDALGKVEAQLRSKLAVALTSTARQARREGIKTLTAETRLKAKDVSGAAADEIKRASPAALMASWTPSTKTKNVAATGTVKWSRGQPLTFATPTRGGMITRASPRGFLIKDKAFHRVASAKGQKGRLVGLKQLKTISPNTLMGQPESRTAASWDRAASRALPLFTAGAVEITFRAAGFQTSDTGTPPRDD
jgi:hypothetical protein